MILFAMFAAVAVYAIGAALINRLDTAMPPYHPAEIRHKVLAQIEACTKCQTTTNVAMIGIALPTVKADDIRAAVTALEHEGRVSRRAAHDLAAIHLKES